MIEYLGHKFINVIDLGLHKCTQCDNMFLIESVRQTYMAENNKIIIEIKCFSYDNINKVLKKIILTCNEQQIKNLLE